MLRVLHVLDHARPLNGGHASRTQAIMKAQAAAGLAVRGITGHAAPATALREWREIGALADAIGEVVEAWRPDVLHAHAPAPCGMAALRAARRHDLPLLYEIRAFAEDAAVADGICREGSFRYRRARALENRVVAGADAVITVCHGLRDELIARGFPGGRIGIMPDGVALDRPAASLQRDRDLARELKLGDGPVIGFIGAFHDYEGLDVLIDAMPALLAERPDARLLLVGDGPIAGDLKQRARASRAARAIRFVGPPPPFELDRYYLLCEVLAYPRRANRLTELVTPLAPLEAMARGRLVAASAVGGHCELVADGETGTLFAPDDPADCARALANLLHRRGGWPAMREAALARVVARHDWSRIAENYLDVYQALLSREARGRLAEAA